MNPSPRTDERAASPFDAILGRTRGTATTVNVWSDDRTAAYRGLVDHVTRGDAAAGVRALNRAASLPDRATADVPWEFGLKTWTAAGAPTREDAQGSLLRIDAALLMPELRTPELRAAEAVRANQQFLTGALRDPSHQAWALARRGQLTVDWLADAYAERYVSHAVTHLVNLLVRDEEALCRRLGYDWSHWEGFGRIRRRVMLLEAVKFLWDGDTPAAERVLGKPHRHFTAQR